MLPLKDDNPRFLKPVINTAIIFVNLLVFFYELSLGKRMLRLFFLSYGIVPFEYTHFTDIDPPSAIPINLFTSMFLHGGWTHIAGNMLYLWIFGDNVEDRLGHFKYLIFYISAGLAAAFTQIIMSPNSKVPMIGASGAISGVLGAYFIWYPGASVYTLVPNPFLFGLFYSIVRIPALIVLGFWFILQIFEGALSIGARGGGVAWFAHVGGFLAGAIIYKIFCRKARKFYADEYSVCGAIIKFDKK